jgi:hypothetical protein
VVVKVSNGLIGKQSYQKTRTIEIKTLYLSINLKKRDMIESGKFERAESLVSSTAMKQFTRAIEEMTKTLLADGFDDNDIREYLECEVGFVVDDVVLPL